MNNVPEELKKYAESNEKEQDKADKEIILDNIRNLASQDKILLQEAEERNIILLGKTRSGKSTLLKVLQKPDYVPPELDLYSETKEPNLSRFTVKYEETNYNLNVMDTPGLFEIKSEQDSERTNEQIKEIIKKCIDWELTRIHLLIITITVETGINKEDIAAIKMLTDMFEDIKDKIILIITHAEGYTVEEKQSLQKQFSENPQLTALKDLLNENIFFSGALQQRNLMNKENAEKVYCNIIMMRNAFYQNLFEKTEFYYVKTMKVIDDISPKYEALIKKHNQLEVQNNQLQEEHNKLKIEHNKLEAEKNKLTEEHNRLKVEYSQLKGEKYQLEEVHNLLKVENSKLKQQLENRSWCIVS